MEIVRYADPGDKTIHTGVLADGQVTPLPVPDLADLWSRPRAEIRSITTEARAPERPVDDLLLLPPIDGATELWAAGVTYARSRDARKEESVLAAAYGLVYEATRPEIFFKSVAWRVVTDFEPVGIRRDSPLNVPEAELALVINAHGEIVGYAVCNDMSSRSIEGENPLYLPQAKVYAGACALGAAIRPAWEVPDPGNLDIELTVVREGANAWQGTTSTSAMCRGLEELASCLFAEQAFPAGAVLTTGTGLVPEMDFALRTDDVIRIAVEGVGSLTNPVVAGKDSFTWLERSINDPFARIPVRPTPNRNGGT
jgi:2-dehydro-3-deoxy-D-arabinonate dehydratase